MGEYEYLTGKDLGYKTRVVEQGKYEYSPLGRIFNKRLEEDDKKDALLKRLSNIKDANEKQFQVIMDERVELLKMIDLN